MADARAKIGGAGIWIVVLCAAAADVRLTAAAPAIPKSAGGADQRARGAIAKAKSAFDLPVARLRFAWTSAVAQRNDLFSVHGTADGARVWAVGATGTILSLRGGEMRIEESGTELDLYGVWAAAADDVWAVGERGTILHRDRRGWTRVASDTKLALYAIWGRNAGEIWIGGEGGTILQGDGRRFQPSPTGSKGAIVSIAPCGRGPQICALDRAGLLPWVDVSNSPCTDPDGDCPIDQPQESEGDRVLRWSDGTWSSYIASAEEPGRIAVAGGGLWRADTTVLRVVRDGRVVRHVPAQAEQDQIRLRGLWAGGEPSGWLVGERCRREETPAGQLLCDRGAIWHVDGKGASLRPEVPWAPLNGVWGWARGAVAIGARGTVMRFDGATWTTLSHPPTDADLRGIWVEDPAASGAGNAPVAVRVNGQGTGAENVELIVGDGSREIWGVPGRSAPPANRDGRAWLFGDCEALSSADGLAWSWFHAKACDRALTRRIAQIGAADVWVGRSDRSALPDHWDGKTWTSVGTPLAIPFREIWGARPDDVWISSVRELINWDGHALARVPFPPEIEGADLITSLWGASASDVWAAAYSGGGVKLLRYNGARWRFDAAFRLEPPRRLLTSDSWLVQNEWSVRRSESQTVALWGTSPSDVWLAGPNGVVLRFDGARWSRVRTPTRAGLLVIGGAHGRVIAAGMSGVILTATPGRGGVRASGADKP